MTICDTFRTLAFSSWDLLRVSKTANVQIGEETLTDLNVLQLRLNHPTEVVTDPLTKPEEGVEGADWEWWFTGSSGRWLGFRVQAKVIELKSDRYKELHYQQKKTGLYQSDTLIRRAINARPKMIPIYCLYSNWSAKGYGSAGGYNPRWSCGSYAPAHESYGCSIMSAFAVRHMRKRRKTRDLRKLLPYMEPWHCLACCSGYSNQDLPHRVWTYWREVLLEGEQRLLQDAAGGFPEDLNSQFIDLFEAYSEVSLTEEPPQYVRSLQEGSLTDLPPETSRLTVFNEQEDRRS